MGYIQPHIMRRVIGSSDCPLVEADVAGQSVLNATKLKLALETFGHLDAGPFGAVYELAYTAPNIVGKPLVLIEGNGSQTFIGKSTDYTSSTDAGRYAAGGCMFNFQGTLTVVQLFLLQEAGAGNRIKLEDASGVLRVESEIAPNAWGGEARILGINIVGPQVATPAWTAWCNAISAQYINKLIVEGCDIQGWNFGSLIAANVVRYGGRINNNYLHNCQIDYVSGTKQLTAISIDDMKPTDGSPFYPDAGVNPFPQPLPAYFTWSHGFQINDNRIEDLRDFQTTTPQVDAINVQTMTEDIQARGNYINGVGDAFDLSCRGSTVADNVIRNCSNGIKLLDGFRGGTITGNRIYDSRFMGIQVSAGTRTYWETEDNVITGNNITGVNTVNMTGITAAAFNLQYIEHPGPPPHSLSQYGRVQRLLVHGNTFDPFGLAYPCLIAGEGFRVRINNNVELRRGEALVSVDSGRMIKSTHSAL